uniref:Pentraxin 3 n=1 Tax=Myripristis murdjan TaxID=586833 RepID=A0A667Z3B5_9TELE
MASSMFRWSLPQAACVLSVFVSLALAYEDDIEVNYSDNYYNEITEGDPQEPTPSTAPCKIPDLTKWDKLFSMLENSQMRENMLLQYADDIVKVEMGSLRGEMLRFVAQYGGSCGAAVETAGRRMSLQLVAKFREVLDRLNPQESKNVAATGNSAGNSNNLEMLLQQLLSATRTQTSRLTKLETSCFSNAGAVMGTGGGMPSTSKMGFEVPQGRGGHRAQDVTSQEVQGALVTSGANLLTVLTKIYSCEMALLFPMRSRRIYTSIIPDVPLSLSSFTVCLWAKPTAVLNKTVLYSYGTRRNPYEIQLLLSRTSALFTVGGEAHLVEARGVVNEPEWIHLCGTWSSKQGLASLWADGRKVASTPGVAEGHILPDGGSLQLGQERNGCCPGSPRFEAKLAFPGKMTGVNMWNRVLSDEEISQMALRDGSGCEMRGNMVAWGVTEMVPHGGAQFIN